MVVSRPRSLHWRLGLVCCGAVEGEGFGEALLPGEVGLIGERGAGGSDVGAGGADVAGARGLELGLDVLVGLAVEFGDEFEEGDAAAATDVENFAGDVLGGRFGGAEVGVDDVADGGEVAGLLAVAENGGRLAGEEGGAKTGDDAGVRGVEGLARAEDVEVAEAHGFEAV